MREKTQIARAIAASALGASVVLGGVAVASPAQAATTTRCHTSTKSFNLPSKPDVTVSLNICARSWTQGGFHHYRAWLNKASWNGSLWFIGGTRFHAFNVNMRLEHGTKRIPSCNSSGVCTLNSLTSVINDNESGSRSYSSTGHGSVGRNSKSATSWVADATVDFDIAGDGTGWRSWDLHGTAAVR